MNNFDKLRIIEKICLKRDLVKPRQLDSWIIKIGLKFTEDGDTLPPAIYTIDNKYDLQAKINGSSCLQFITFILEAISGILVFHDLNTEQIFWSVSNDRFMEEFGIPIPKIIIPKNAVS